MYSINQKFVFIFSIIFLFLLPSSSYAEQATGLWHQTDLDGRSDVWYYGQDSSKNYKTSGSNSGVLSIDLGKISQPKLSLEMKYETETSTYYDAMKITIADKVLWERQANKSKNEDGDWVWESLTFSLEEYQGADITLNFSFDTKDSVGNNYFGWAIDNIELSGNEKKATDIPKLLTEFLTRCTANFDKQNNKLIIPCLNLDGTSYWAELKVDLSQEPISLIVENLELNKSGQLPGPEILVDKINNALNPSPTPTPDFAPEPIATPEATSELTPQPTPQAVPEPTPIAIPTTTPQVTPQITPQTTPSITDGELPQVDIPPATTPMTTAVPELPSAIGL